VEPVVTSAEMSACDRFAIESLHIPSTILMEHAGKGVVDAMEKHFASLSGRTVLVVCGKGNNGGDGFVAARHLFNQGASVTVALVGKQKDLKHDARDHYTILKDISKSSDHSGMLHLIEVHSIKKFSSLQHSEFIVDAIFGTGFSGPARGIYKSIIERMNQGKGKKVSIDIPSGLNADTGVIANVAFRADLTVTMGLKKAGLVLNSGMTHSGKIDVVDIGIPPFVLHSKERKTFILRADDVNKILPTRSIHSHKYSVGKVFVLAGSRGLTGAAAMVATSAMRAGTGAVVLGTPASIYPILAKKLTEVMVEPLPETSEGTLSLEAYENMKKHLQWADVIIIGPGLSRNIETCDLVKKILAEVDKRLVIDADGLNALSENPSILKKHRNKDVIITPHVGELSRLINIPSEAIENNRVEISRSTAKNFKFTVVVKGAPTITASEDGIAVINSTGNPGMATAGSGDVLAGLIGGLWAQGMSRSAAASAGVFVHGYAGDLAKNAYGEKSMMATDILHCIPEAMQRMERGEII
jgi:hydroxyethylthiazole kinase-like uncharacterized protein yjeF